VRICRRCCTPRRRLQRPAQVLEVRCLPCTLHNNNPLSIIFVLQCSHSFPPDSTPLTASSLAGRSARHTCSRRRTQISLLQRLETPLQISFFLFLCNNPSGAVARCEDCSIFSAAARAGGGASSTGCVAGLLSVCALAILRLNVWGVCAWVCVCRIWVCTLAFMIRIHINPCLHINW
jgi:hypothetical protein